ncbi:MAG: SPOR domain-containing protein [Armatimonadota bacterium]|nr:SPOR domain-containing protein [Armatimonadota bacterium]
MPPIPRRAASPQPGPAQTLYIVQVGAFTSRERAGQLADALRAEGFAPYVVHEGGLYKVRVGAFRDRARAQDLAARVRARGYDAAVLH